MKVHIAGIGGEGWSWIAKILIEKGWDVSGCNLDENERVRFLKDIGLKEFELGNSPAHIHHDINYFLYTSALLSDTENTLELEAAREKNIRACDRNEFLPILLNDRKVIAVAGTHGKTTTSSLLSFLLDALGDECGFGIGGTVKNFSTNGRNGASETFVVEADEFADAFLGLKPYASIIASMEMEHHDYFKSYAHYKESFAKFIDNTREFAVIFGDTKDLVDLADKSGKRIISYGESVINDYQIKNIKTKGFKTMWQVQNKDKVYNLELPFPGKQYIYNTTAAVVMCAELGYSMSEIIPNLKKFIGAGRRFELIEKKGVTVVNDYGHHPAELKITFEAALSTGKKVNVVYEPHQYKRSAELLNDFNGIFNGANLLVQTSIYASRETPPYPIINEEFFDVSKTGAKKSIYVNNWEECAEEAIKNTKPGELILVLAVGHGDKIVSKILEEI